MVQHMTSTIDDGSKKGKRTAFLIKKLIAEAAEEMDDVPPEMISFYMNRAAAMMYWAATGERIVNMPLPPDFNPPAHLDIPDAPTLSPAERESWLELEGISKPDPEEVDAEQRRAIMNGGQETQ